MRNVVARLPAGVSGRSVLGVGWVVWLRWLSHACRRVTGLSGQCSAASGSGLKVVPLHIFARAAAPAAHQRPPLLFPCPLRAALVPFGRVVSLPLLSRLPLLWLLLTPPSLLGLALFFSSTLRSLNVAP